MPAWGCCWCEPESSSEEESSEEESGSGSEEESSSEEAHEVAHGLGGLHLADHAPALTAGAAAGVAAGAAVAATAAHAQQQAHGPPVYQPVPAPPLPYGSAPPPQSVYAPYSLPDGRPQAVAAAYAPPRGGSGDEDEDSDEEGSPRRLADYRPPLFTVTDAHLTFRLHPEETVVDAVLTVCATAPAAPGCAPPLVLDGERAGGSGQGAHVMLAGRRPELLHAACTTQAAGCWCSSCPGLPWRAAAVALPHPSQCSCSPASRHLSPLAGHKDLRLASVAVEGRQLAPGQFQRGPQALTIPPALLPPAAAQPGAPFQVSTRVLLCPRTNTHLEVRWGCRVGLLCARANAAALWSRPDALELPPHGASGARTAAAHVHSSAPGALRSLTLLADHTLRWPTRTCPLLPFCTAGPVHDGRAAGD